MHRMDQKWKRCLLVCEFCSER